MQLVCNLGLSAVILHSSRYVVVCGRHDPSVRVLSCLALSNSSELHRELESAILCQKFLTRPDLQPGMKFKCGV